MSRLQDELQMNKYLAGDKLPSVRGILVLLASHTIKALSEKKKALADLQRVANEPAMSQSDLEALKGQIKEISTENNKIIEQRLSSNTGDDKLNILRQQACFICVIRSTHALFQIAIISGKKESTAERLHEKEAEVCLGRPIRLDVTFLLVFRLGGRARQEETCQ
jgi:hypothetical protein